MVDSIKRALGAPQYLLYGNTIGGWLTAGLIALAVWSILELLHRLIESRYKRYLSAGHRPPVRLLAQLIGNTKQFLLFGIALYSGLQSLTLPQKLQGVIADCLLLLILLQTGLWAVRAVRFYLELKEKERAPDHVLASSLDIINFVAKLLIWSLLILVALDNVGVNITALLAGLGVGGIAVALALQNILGDLFASLSIALDRPFVVGDTLTIDAFNGVVERIGIKTTRLRSEAGELIILSNADILKSRVRNYAGAAELRALTRIRVAYDTPAEKLREIPQLIERIVREQPQARFERCHLINFGDWALQFELAYFRREPDSYPLLDLQQAVNLRIVEEFQRLGVEFAVPTQRVVATV